MSYSDEIWYVDSGGRTNNHSLSSLKARNKYFIFKSAHEERANIQNLWAAVAKLRRWVTENFRSVINLQSNIHVLFAVDAHI